MYVTNYMQIIHSRPPVPSQAVIINSLSKTSPLPLDVGSSSAARSSPRDDADPLASTPQTATSSQTAKLYTSETQLEFVPNSLRSASLLDETNVQTNRRNEQDDDKDVATPGQRFVVNMVGNAWAVSSLICTIPTEQNKILCSLSVARLRVLKEPFI